MGEQRWITQLIRAAGAYAIVCGSITLAGWLLNFPRLTDWEGAGISMMPNTALCAICSGAALILFPLGHWRVIRGLGIAVALIGTATLAEHLSGVDLRIDRLLVFHEWGQRGTVAPGRMGPPASLSWTMLGTALFLMSASGRSRSVAVALGIAVMLIAILSLVGRFFGADPKSTWPWTRWETCWP